MCKTSTYVQCQIQSFMVQSEGPGADGRQRMVFSIRTAWWMKLFASLVERACRLLNLPPEGSRLKWGGVQVVSISMGESSGTPIILLAAFPMCCRVFRQGAVQLSYYPDIFNGVSVRRAHYRRWEVCSSLFQEEVEVCQTCHPLHISTVDGQFDGLLLKSITISLVLPTLRIRSLHRWSRFKENKCAFVAFLSQ